MTDEQYISFEVDLYYPRQTAKISCSVNYCYRGSGKPSLCGRFSLEELSPLLLNLMKSHRASRICLTLNANLDECIVLEGLEFLSGISDHVEALQFGEWGSMEILNMTGIEAMQNLTHFTWGNRLYNVRNKASRVKIHNLYGLEWCSSLRSLAIFRGPFQVAHLASLNITKLYLKRERDCDSLHQQRADPLHQQRADREGASPRRDGREGASPRRDDPLHRQRDALLAEESWWRLADLNLESLAEIGMCGEQELIELIELDSRLPSLQAIVTRESLITKSIQEYLNRHIDKGRCTGLSYVSGGYSECLQVLTNLAVDHYPGHGSFRLSRSVTIIFSATGYRIAEPDDQAGQIWIRLEKDPETKDDVVIPSLEFIRDMAPRVIRIDVGTGLVLESLVGLEQCSLLESLSLDMKSLKRDEPIDLSHLPICSLSITNATSTKTLQSLIGPQL